MAVEYVRTVAVEHGCKPVWSPYYKAWCCGCEDELHFSDQQSSMLTLKSAERTRL